MRTVLWSVVPLVVSLVVLGQPAPKAPPDKAAVERLLTDYQNTPFADRGKFVADEKEFAAGQAIYYKGKTHNTGVVVKVKTVEPGPKPGVFTVTASYEAKGASGAGEVIVVATKDGLRVDWGAMTGFNPIGFKAWAAGTDTAVVFRVSAELSDLYLFTFGNAKQTHYSIRCTERFGDRVATFHGYIRKDTTEGKRLYELLKDGQRHEVTLKFMRVPGGEDGYLSITELVSESWVK